MKTCIALLRTRNSHKTVNQLNFTSHVSKQTESFFVAKQTCKQEHRGELFGPSPWRRVAVTLYQSSPCVSTV